MSATGRRVVVTGAGSGIGAATARKLMAEGWRVACLDRNEEAARQVADGQVAMGVDVSDESAVVSAMAEAVAALGGLDGLATCAGIYDTTSFVDSDAETFRRMHDINVVGTFLCIREAAKCMEPGARICTVGSIVGLRGGTAGSAAYAASKGAVITLTKSAARELGPRGIAVNTVAPGVIDTPLVGMPLVDPGMRARVEDMTSLGRLGTADEIAGVIAWLLSSGASYVHGATVVADAGTVMY